MQTVSRSHLANDYQANVCQLSLYNLQLTTVQSFSGTTQSGYNKLEFFLKRSRQTPQQIFSRRAFRPSSLSFLCVASFSRCKHINTSSYLCDMEHLQIRSEVNFFHTNTHTHEKKKNRKENKNASSRSLLWAWTGHRRLFSTVWECTTYRDGRGRSQVISRWS